MHTLLVAFDTQNFTGEAGIKAGGSAFATIKADRKQGGFQVDKIEVGSDAKLVGEFRSVVTRIVVFTVRIFTSF